MPHIVLSGYLGCGNLGDDAVMLGVVEALGSSFDFTVLSGNPDETYRQHGLGAVHRKDPRAIEGALGPADALIIPGGSIFQDVTSVRSNFYYSQIIKSAKKNNCKVILLGQGVGPLTTYFGKRVAAKSFQLADLIVVRDPGSKTLLEQIGVTKKVHVAADTALLLKPPVLEEESSFGVGNMQSIAIAPRPIHRKGIDEVALFGEFCRLLFQAGFNPNLIEMDSAEDGEVIEAISKQQGGRIPQLRKLGSPRLVQNRLARMSSVVAMRLHAGILASTVGVPPLMVSYDPKVAAYARQLELSNALPLEGLTPARLFEAFQTHLKNQERHRALMPMKLAELRQQAMVNIDLALECLGRKPVA